MNYGIVIHGGAGTMNRKDMTPEKEKQYREALEESVTLGYKILKDGGTSQEAVEHSIRVMENSPLFNAGKGAVLTAEKTIELDAAFMNGKDLNAGAVASVKTIKNPITAAIKVMEESPHVLLSARGAEKFAKEKGLNFIKLDGSVGIIGNGAGLVMSTLDVVAEHGGSASNFLDIGGGAKSETVSAALEVLETDPNVKSVLINIFGGITRCDLVAEGIVEATNGKKLKWPIVIRLDGTNSTEGLEILKNNPNDNIFISENMDEAAKLAVKSGN